MIFQLKIFNFSVTAGDLNRLSSFEDIIMDFFHQMDKSGLLDDTFVMLGGDHGFRVGEYFATNAGAYEAR